MTQNNIDLASIFQIVTNSLLENQQNLDHADTYNQDHGTNMVQTFQTITHALEKKKGSSDSAALTYAAERLSESATSGSGKMYAQNLSQAAAQVKGQNVDIQGAMQLLQTLVGASQANQTSQKPNTQAATGGDVLTSILGGLTGAETQTQNPSSAGSGDLLSTLLGAGGQEMSGQQTNTSGSGDLMSAILGGLTGNQSNNTSAPQSGGFNLDDLVSAGLAFFSSKQQGQNNMQALVNAFMSGSGMGTSIHRNQSTQIVIQSFLNALNSNSSQAQSSAAK